MGNFEEREDSETTVAPLRPRPALPVGTPADTRKPPAWVVGYLLLCVGLTLIGLVVLFFEHRMLGGASP